MADSLTDTTSVPELVGLAAADAHDAALDARLLACLLYTSDAADE